MAPAKKQRECPQHWVPLVPSKIAIAKAFDVTADVCPRCQGLFLDKGEVQRITGNEKLGDFLTKHMGDDSDSHRVCPRDGLVMDAEDADGVRVDVCLTCFGVWLDHGELEALRGKSEDAFDPSFFSVEKKKEVERASKRKASERKLYWASFLHRLAGRDLLQKRK